MNVKLFDEPESKKRWSLSVTALKLEILCVSQFTLYSRTKGNKPDFHEAMPTEESRKLYENLVAKLQSQYVPALVKGILKRVHQILANKF